MWSVQGRRTPHCDPSRPRQVLAQRLAEATRAFTDLMTKDVPWLSAELRKTPLRDVIGSGVAP
jgi:hypothetical protein